MKATGFIRLDNEQDCSFQRDPGDHMFFDMQSLLVIFSRLEYHSDNEFYIMPVM